MNYHNTALSDLIFYVVPSWKCNLNCSHCTVKNQSFNINKKAFFNTLICQKEEYPNATFILHGGEPTFDKKLFVDILNTNIISSITTNLVFNDEQILEMINDYDLEVATSWNPKRFSSKTLLANWMNNLTKLKKSPLLLITLDKDIINISPKDMIKIVKSFKNIKEILFECLIDNSLDDDFQNKVDIWLCELDEQWITQKINIKNLIKEYILDWNFNCNSKTILPDGTIQEKCIFANNYKPHVLSKCIKCKYNKVCIPCKLHTRCSFFPKFYERVRNEK